MTIDNTKTNGFTRKRLFDILVGIKFGLEGYPHIFELILCKKVKKLFSKWKSSELLIHEVGREYANIFFRESPLMKHLRKSATSFDGGAFIQRPLIYDGHDEY